MRYAFDEARARIEASKGLHAICICCNSKVIARCGNIRMGHWAHAAKADCDPWWEHETEWHRDWKNLFPKDWQETVMHDPVRDERHIADVYHPGKKLVLEFQNSVMSLEEARSREAFYQKMIWVLNGEKLNYAAEPLQPDAGIEAHLKANAVTAHKPFRDAHHAWLARTEQELEDLFAEAQKNPQRMFAWRKRNAEILSERNDRDEALKSKREELISFFRQPYVHELDMHRELNHHLLHADRYVLNHWRYKQKRWQQAKAPVFIDLGDELIWIKSEYIGKAVPKEKFIAKYGV